MQGIPSLLRLAEYRALSGTTLGGRVLDLGGERRSSYHKLFRGEFEVVVLNIQKETQPDIVHDLEHPLPIDDASYNGVLLINVLEHVFEYRTLLREAARVLKPGGKIVVVVPFLFPVHPSPMDFHRFTKDTLARELEMLGVRDVSVTPLGGGVFSARYVLLDRLLPKPLRFISFYTCRYVAYALDALAVALARVLHKAYNPADYALGYCATATKV